MKTRLLFASFLFVACMSAQAQTSEIEYRPFAEEGKNWRTQVGGILENLYRGDIIGDTIIGNVKVENGCKLNIRNRKSVLIKNRFECKLGGELQIK